MKLLDPQGETDMSERVGSMGLAVPKGITPAGSGNAGQPKEVVGSILGHTYWLKAECDGCFIFETLDPPGTFVPPHKTPLQWAARLVANQRAMDLALDDQRIDDAAEIVSAGEVEPPKGKLSLLQCACLTDFSFGKQRAINAILNEAWLTLEQMPIYQRKL
jgi:hypothetical protein